MNCISFRSAKLNTDVTLAMAVKNKVLFSSRKLILKAVFLEL